MVTKLVDLTTISFVGYVLAKIHMVTKPMVFNSIIVFWLCSSKNPYGNKTADR